MRKCLQIYIAAILIGFLISCKEQTQTTQLNGQISQKETLLIDRIHPIQKIDTIWTTNAPSRITRKIRKDKEGNLLFAAFEDIIRYDGVSFTKMRKEEGLDSYDAFDVWEDRNGSIWIASTSQGVFKYPASTDLKIGKKGYSLFTTKNGLTHNRAMCIYEDMAGGIWIGTQDGISYYDGKTSNDGQLVFRNFIKKDGLTNSDINTIMEDKTGKIWVGTRGNLSIYDPVKNLKQDEVPFTEITTNEGKPFENIWAIIEDEKGNIWLGGQYGLWLYDGNSFTNLTTKNVMSVYEDKKGNVWFTHQAGFSRYDQKSLLSNDPKATQVFIGDGMLLGITEDKDGYIWIGKLDAVLRYDGKSVTYFGNEESNTK